MQQESTTTEPGSFQLCIAGSFMMDLIAYVSRRPKPGETIAGIEFKQLPGGKGFNQAIAGARSGACTSMVGCLGRDAFGNQFRHALDEANVDHARVQAHPYVGTGVGLPMVTAGGENQIVIIPRANLELTPDHVETALREITPAVLLLQLELTMPTTIRAATVGRELGATVILNPAPYVPLPEELSDQLDVLILNEGEAADWLGLPADVSEDQRLKSLVAEANRRELSIIVTLGSAGLMLVRPHQEPITLPGHQMDVIDTIGAGDAFCGYLAGRLSQGVEMADALREANAAAAISVTRAGGAACPTVEEVTDFLGAERS